MAFEEKRRKTALASSGAARLRRILWDEWLSMRETISACNHGGEDRWTD